MIPFIWNSGKGKTTEQTKQGLSGAEGKGLSHKGYEESFQVAESFYIFIVMADTQPYAFSKFLVMHNIGSEFC